jgi:hypothetical protein
MHSFVVDGQAFPISQVSLEEATLCVVWRAQAPDPQDWAIGLVSESLFLFCPTAPQVLMSSGHSTPVKPELVEPVSFFGSGLVSDQDEELHS